MPVDSVKALCQAIQDNDILEPAQLKEFVSLQKKFTDLKALAKELMTRDWLTAYQVNLLLQGRGAELVLGDNILLERIGAGGMGAVFKARHKRLERIVAIKVIRKEQLGNSTAVQRFQQEAKAAARLSHANIVTIHDASATADGTQYLVMEYMEGTDLSKLVKERGPLSIAAACECIRQAALGLQHAHEQGMVHRDIKPHNLMLKTPLHPPLHKGGAGGVVKILDMGLARLGASTEAAAAGEGEGEGITASGTIVGTVDYMAPEQADDSRKADIRADIYSLGCTLYFLLAGRVPFPGGELLGKLLRHKTEEPAALEKLRPDVPPAVAAVVRKMTAKDPKSRYQTPAEVARAMAPLVAQYRKDKPAGSTGILPVPAGSTGILPVPAGSPGILPVPAGSPGILPVQHRLEAGATSDQVPSDEELSYTLSSELSARPTQLDRPGLGHAALALLGRLLGRSAALWWRGLTRGSVNRRVAIGAITLVVPLLLLVFGIPRKRRSPDPKPDPDPTPKPLLREIVNSIGMKFVLIPAGTFRMGTPGAGPPEAAHLVEITQPFYMGKYEVTQEQMEKVMGANPSAFVKDKDGRLNLHHPAENVSYFLAVEFCKALSEQPAEKQAGRFYRLPWEAEWEYCCRAGSQLAYSFGEDPLPLAKYAWYSKNADGKTHPVGLLLPNAWGLHDMEGNVWEWCGDWYGDYESKLMKDPQGARTGDRRVLRGGSWYHDEGLCRAAFRNPHEPPGNRYNSVGFRVVCVVAGGGR